MIIILAALRWEVSEILALLKGRRRISPRLWKGELAGRQVTVMLTGIGVKYRREVSSFLRKEDFSFAISFGLAGAVNPGIVAGSVVWCDEVRDPSGRVFRLERRSAVGYLAESGIVCGASLTVSRAVLTSPGKERLFRFRRTDIVEMESFHLAEILSSIGKPLVIIRAVSDTAFQRWTRPWEFVLGARMARQNLSKAVVSLLGSDPTPCRKPLVEKCRT